MLRFLLVEAAQAAARIHPDWRRRYIHLAVRRVEELTLLCNQVPGQRFPLSVKSKFTGLTGIVFIARAR